MTYDMERLKTRLAKAKTSLMLEHPFFGAVALNMPHTITEFASPHAGMKPTACTNGKRVLYHPDFIKDLSDEQLKFLVAHECMHPMLEHNFRRQGRDPRKWNMAADYVINQILTEEGVGKFIDGGCLNKAIYDAGGGSSEGIYNILPDSDGDGSGQGGGGTGMDLEDGEGTQQDRDQQAAEWKVRTAQAAQAAKMAGKLSAGLERFVSEVLNPKVDWREVLQRFVVKCKTEDRTFSRPNRRFASQGLYLPSITGEVMGPMVVAVDCSGSITDEILNQFAAEIRTIKEDQQPVAIHVVYFDSEVSHYEVYGRDDDLNIRPHGGGGTAFSPVIEYIDEHNIDPVCCVFLTDLYCHDFGDQPGYPVLWVSNGTDEAPWGEVVMMKD